MRRIVLMCTFVTSAYLLVGCSTAPKTVAKEEQLNARVQGAIQAAKATDPGLQRLFDTSVAYAVFPDVGKGAVGIGGAYGQGELYQNGQLVGYCTLTQATVGLALGGQSYTELIFFQDQSAVDRFKSGGLAFAADATAVALRAGASANVNYSNGVAVFTLGQAGLMAGASIGGQKFSYAPVLGQEQTVQQASSQ